MAGAGGKKRKFINQETEGITMGQVIKNLMAAPSSITDSSAALLWEPVDNEETAYYKVFVDGIEAGKADCTDYTVTGLQSGCEYSFQVKAYSGDGRITAESDVILGTARKARERFDITAFGALGDGAHMNTLVIQSAVDACTPGGRVVIPPGTFLTGAIFLKSNMTLYLEEGAVLLGSPYAADYPLLQYRWEGREHICHASLINAGNKGEGKLHDITIEGGGTIDANGAHLKRDEQSRGQGERGRAMALCHTDGVYLKDITVRQSPSWCVHLIYCQNISINQVKVHTKYDENGRKYKDINNGDGIDPDSCKNVYIFHSLISSQDDCIAIKSGRDEEGRQTGIPTEHVRVTNCRFRSGFGVAVGSEMSGGVRDVLVRDCDFEDTYSVGSVKAPRGRGGVIENICYENCTFRNHSLEHSDCRWFRGAVYIDQFYSYETFDADKAEAIGEGTSVIRNITFRNIKLETFAGNAVFMAGLPERKLENIILENIQAKGRYGLKAYNIKGLSMKNVQVEALEGEACQYRNVTFV